jgi:hypothetical protein
MLSEFIRESAAAAVWRVPCFDGAIIIEGRILSPAEAESAGITSGLIAAEMTTNRKGSMAGLEALSQRLESEGDDLSQETIDMMLKQMKRIRPESLLGLAEQQDRIISQCVKSASMDSGESWEPLRFVTAQDQQDPERGMLWVGMLSSADRSAIIDSAMKGHEVAASRLATFRK